jgi:hypothetical protein
MLKSDWLGQTNKQTNFKDIFSAITLSFRKGNKSSVVHADHPRPSFLNK